MQIGHIWICVKVMCRVCTWLRGLSKCTETQMKWIRVKLRRKMQRLLRLDTLYRVMQIKEGCFREIYGERMQRKSELWQTERAIKNPKKTGERTHTHTHKKSNIWRCWANKQRRGRGRGSPRRPIVSDAFTVVMMHPAAGPLLSLKLYEASLAHILLQWHHCLAHSSLAAGWWRWWWRGLQRNKPMETYIRNMGEGKDERVRDAKE